MRRSKLLVATAALAVMVASGASAKLLGAILDDLGIPGEDLDIMMAHAHALYAETEPRAGSEATWSNDRTGSEGRVRVLSYEVPCALIEHVVLVKGESAPAAFRVRRCKTESGDWLMEFVR